LLPNVDSFDQVVTEKNSFLEINQSEIRIACEFSSEIARPSETKLGRKHPLKVLYQDF
jgi:hypothetical protein